MIRTCFVKDPAPIYRKSYAAAQLHSAKNPLKEKESYNFNCRRFCKNSDGPYCSAGADMKFCGKNCAFVK